jgi:aromatic ring-opening dioxygenase catalytic subunit (LigB family)
VRSFYYDKRRRYRKRAPVANGEDHVFFTDARLMGTIVGAMLSTHAYTFVDPATWDTRRATRTRRNYAAKYGSVPPERPEVATETDADIERRFATIRSGFAEVRRRLAEARADTLLIIGNDQDENFSPHLLPQFAVYTGADFRIVSRTAGESAAAAAATTYRAAPKLGRAIVEFALESGFDPATIEEFSGGALEAHAHREPLQFYDPAATQTVLPIFVNAIHPPAPSPMRCYAFGRMLRAAIERSPDAGRVLLLASGGLSHFPADFPWREYAGPLTIGAVCADFDRRSVAAMRGGNGALLAALSSADLMANGNDELRQTIVMLGALGTAVPAFLHYEPFYRAIMGIAVGCWDTIPALTG